MTLPAQPAVIFFNNVGYLNLCGHGSIGLIVTLAHLGRIQPGTHRINTPVGAITAELHANGTVTIGNVVPATGWRKNVGVEVDNYGTALGRCGMGR